MAGARRGTAKPAKTPKGRAKRARSPSLSDQVASSASPSRSPVRRASVGTIALVEVNETATVCDTTSVPCALWGLMHTYDLVVREEFRGRAEDLYAYLVTRRMPTARTQKDETRPSIDGNWAVPYGAAGYLVERDGTAAGDDGEWEVPPGWGVVSHDGTHLFVDHVAREACEEVPTSRRAKKKK